VSTNGARVRDVEVPVVFSHMSCQKIRKLLESLYYIVLAGGKPVHRMGELVGTSKIFPRTEKMKFLAFSKISTQICECPYIAMDVSVGPRTVTPDQ
jgi:hypothetical protein